MDAIPTGSGDLLVSLETGELALESIRGACADHDLTDGAVVAAVATFRNLHVHYLHTDVTAPPEERNTYLDLEGPWEVAGIQGLVAGGDPHLHVVAYDGERTVVGHLEENTEVNALAELLILDFGGPALTRRPDENGVGSLERE